MWPYTDEESEWLSPPHAAPPEPDDEPEPEPWELLEFEDGVGWEAA